MSLLKSEVAGNSNSYSNILPPIFDTLELDRDKIPSPGDISLLKIMIMEGGMPLGYQSSPVRLTLEDGPSALPLAVGDTTHLTVSAWAQGPSDAKFTTGFAVMFWVESGAASLMGGEGTILGEMPGNRYDMTMDSESGAHATIYVRVDGPGPITIRAKIPACGETGKGRWCDTVLLTDPVIINGP
jgi:hypothetical protein